MIKSLLSVFSVGALCVSSFAQPNLYWAKQLRTFSGNSSDSRGYTVVRDNAGNVISGGRFNDSIDLNPGAPLSVIGTVSSSGYVSKLDPQGNFVWGAKVDCQFSHVSSIVTDDSNNVYVTGFFNGLCDFDPGPGVFNLSSSSREVFIWKLSPAGNLMWAEQVGGPAFDDSYRMCIDANGNLILTGVFAGIGDFDPGLGTYNLVASPGDETFILKLNSNGGLIWAVSFNCTSGAGITGLDIDTDPWSNVYLTGVFEGSSPVDFDPGAGLVPVTPIGNNDGFVVKLTSAGNYIWSRTFGDTLYDGYREIEVLDDKLFLYGYFTNTVDLDPGPATSVHVSTGFPGDADPFLCKLDSSGNLIWLSQFGGAPIQNASEIGAMAIDNKGRTYLTGQFDDGTDWDPGPGNAAFPMDWQMEVPLCAYDSTGAMLWAVELPGVNWTAGVAISVDVNGSFIDLTGSFQDSLDCDPNVGTFVMHPATMEDAMICRFATGPDGVEELAENNSVSVFPNPTNGVLNITSENKLEQIVICDLSGREVYVQNFRSPLRSVQLQLNLSPGVYVLTCLNADGNISAQRFIVQ